MKKTFWIIALLLGIGLTVFGLQSTRVYASETEMYLDVITDTFDEPYAETYRLAATVEFLRLYRTYPKPRNFSCVTTLKLSDT
jgi:hypothetical protein